jgi:hypothetical protein
LNQLGVIAVSLGIGNELHEIAEQSPEGPWRDATLAGAEGDLRRVADTYASFGSPTLESDARLHGGESLIRAGLRTEGEAELRKALAFYRSVGASFKVRRAEALLAKSA